MKKNKLSIGILTYNHERYIAKVLEGIFSQEVDFSYLVYINDDASTDSTIQIIAAFQARYPDQIILFSNLTNRGQLNGIMNFLAHADGEYLTICDGDDYWTYPCKLQQQIDFLDSHPEYVASCHDAEIVSDAIDGKNSVAQLQTKSQFKFISQFTTYRGVDIEHWELLTGVTYIQNCTLVWRRFDLTEYMHLFTSVQFNLDWIFNSVVSIQGKVQYINEPWAVYSDHSAGRTKNNYFFIYYFDKIKTLKLMLKMKHFQPACHRRHLYTLLTKQYNDLIEGVSDGRKTRKMMVKFQLGYLFYSLLSVWEHLRYFMVENRRLMRQ